MIYILVGIPGSGKTTIATHLASEYKIRHISYRTIVHEYMAGRRIRDRERQKWLEFKPFTPKLAVKILTDYLSKEGQDNFILEGFPKSADEARLLADYIGRKNFKSKDVITFVVNTPKEVALLRLNNRIVCPDCSYVCPKPNPLKILGNYCPNCHLKLIKRQDDDEKKIEYRLARYEKENKGIIIELKRISKVIQIDGSQPLAEVISDVVEQVDGGAHDKLTIEAERGARMLVEGLGLDLADPNMVRTPKRIVKTLIELTEGNHFNAQKEIRELLDIAFPTIYKGMVILDPIKVYSLCSHHLLSIEYEVLFGYIPKNLSIGFSKIIKAIRLLAAKPTLQEDFTQDVIDTFQKVLDPKGIMIVVRGKHSCMMIRGEKTVNSNITSALRGDFKTSQKTREEFLSLAKFKS